jgi:hypothetical protein
MTKFLTHHRQLLTLAAASATEITATSAPGGTESKPVHISPIRGVEPPACIIGAIKLTGATTSRPRHDPSHYERVRHNLSANRWEPVSVLVNIRSVAQLVTCTFDFLKPVG